MGESEKDILPDVKNIKTQETYTLPSKGLVYNQEDGIPASITLRRMTTKEDKIRLRNQGEDRIRKDILQACIVEPIDAGKLKLMDANLLLFRLRALSLLDDTYKVHCYCNKCSTQFVHQINLSEVPVNYMTDEKLKKLKVELPMSKAKIDFKYPSLNDMIVMSDRLKEYFDRFPDADKTEALYTVSTILYIDRVNNHTLLSEELEHWVDSLDILDSRAVRNIIGDLDVTFGFNEELKTKCPTCGNIVKHGLPITSELFNPSK